MESLHETGILYKRDTKGKIRTWESKAVDDLENALVYTYSGIKDGVIKEHITKVEPSATMTANEVAVSKVTSTKESKLKSGYFPTEQEAMDYKSTKVMLLHKFGENKGKVAYPVLVQPKLDGVCAKFVNSRTDPHFISREDNRFPKLDTMAGALRDYLDTLDLTGVQEQMDAHGELYAHGHHVSEVIEAIKGDNPGVLEKLQFFIFDYMGADAESMSYRSRLRRGSIVYDWSNPGKPYVPIKTLVAHSEAEVYKARDLFISQGFEGVVVCDPRAEYMYDRRTYGKLKEKLLNTDEFKIIECGFESNGPDRLIMFTCETKDGLGFSVRPAWDHNRRRVAWENFRTNPGDFIGSMATVEYRGLTKYNIPFHGVLTAIRDYE